MQHYVEMLDMVHKAIKVEQQLKRKGFVRRGQNSIKSSSCRPSGRREDQPQNKPKLDLPKDNKIGVAPVPGKTEPIPSRNRDIKCFKCQGRDHITRQCPNKWVMIIGSQREIESDDEEEDEDSMPPLEDAYDVEYPVEGKLLVVRRALGVQSKEHEEIQCENLFHTRCLVNDKVCSMRIDRGSCTNVASTESVEKLVLTTLKHPRPYNIQWLNDCGEMKVNKQVLVAFSFGKFMDEVLCDVVPMHACHILLGRPCQFDRPVNYDGFTNRYSFVPNKRPIILVPLTPK